MINTQTIDNVADPAEPPRTRGIVLNRAAKVYDLLIPIVTLWQDKRIIRRTVALLEPAPTDKVLDLGCATGSVALAVAKMLDGECGGLSIGLDAAPGMIAKARSKLRQLPCRFDIGVAEELPYKDEVFDKVVSTFMFHHLNLQDKLAALREVCRVLKPGGKMVLVDVDVPTTRFGRFCARAGEWLFRQSEIGENIDGKLRGLFQPAGFDRVEQLTHDMGYVTTFALTKRQ